MKTPPFLIMLLLWIVCVPAFTATASATETAATSEHNPAVYTFGVTPQFPQRQLYAIWNPVITELSRRTGLKFKLVTTLTIENFEKEFGMGAFDFVYVNPYHVTKSPGYLPLVADSAPLRGILVVRRDAPIQSLKELEGKEVAFPSPNALGASLLMRADLEHLHHVKIKPLYVKTHSSVYLHVVKGLAAAGGGVDKSLSEQDPAIRNALRVIYTTREIASHPVAAHRRVRPADREKVRRALLAMDATPEGKALLAKIPVKQLMPVSLADYEKMRAWGLDAYWVDLWKEEPVK
jgi:phosphonate transport system substrate-binding protein